MTVKNLRDALEQLPRVYYGFSSGVFLMALPLSWWGRIGIGYGMLVILRILFPEPRQ